MPARSEFRLVVVDDDYDANAGLCRLLQVSGFHLAGRAYDGLSGLDVIKSTNPDVAIVDIQMPVLDGYGLARRVAAEVPSPPWLIAVSGISGDASKVEAISAGFAAFFPKPADWPAIELLLAHYAGEG